MGTNQITRTTKRSTGKSESPVQTQKPRRLRDPKQKPPPSPQMRVCQSHAASVPGLTSRLSPDTGHLLFLRILQGLEEAVTQKQSEWQTHQPGIPYLPYQSHKGTVYTWSRTKRQVYFATTWDRTQVPQDAMGPLPSSAKLTQPVPAPTPSSALGRPRGVGRSWRCGTLRGCAEEGVWAHQLRAFRGMRGGQPAQPRSGGRSGRWGDHQQACGRAGGRAHAGVDGGTAVGAARRTWTAGSKPQRRRNKHRRAVRDGPEGGRWRPCCEQGGARGGSHRGNERLPGGERLTLADPERWLQRKP